MLAVWQRANDETTNTCDWTAHNRDLPAALVEETLPHVQRRASRVVDNCAGASFLAKFETSTDQGRPGYLSIATALFLVELCVILSTFLH